MISGVGIDIESVQRFKESYQDSNFINLIFTKSEITYCQAKKEPYISFAGKFCAKEAIIKASDKILSIKSIEVINEDSGKIKIMIDGKINHQIHCSISHTADYAVAIVVIEKK